MTNMSLCCTSAEVMFIETVTMSIFEVSYFVAFYLCVISEFGSFNLHHILYCFKCSKLHAAYSCELWNSNLYILETIKVFLFNKLESKMLRCPIHCSMSACHAAKVSKISSFTIKVLPPPCVMLFLACNVISCLQCYFSLCNVISNTVAIRKIYYP